ncbi:NAD(P)-binding protein [Aspergillus californicus]
MSPPTIVLITGANRGIGRGLLELYLSKPNHTVVAANRDPDHPTSKEILALPRATGTTVKLVKVDMASETDAADAAEILKTRDGIDHIDILIANAGIAYSWPKLEDVMIQDIRTHFETNVLGFVRVYQAFMSVLKRSNDPKLVTIGSSAAFLTVLSVFRPTPKGVVLSCRNTINFPNAAYAPTKLVQHWYTKTVAVMEPWLTAFPVDPGFVQTDMGNRGAALLGIGKATITIEESVRGVLSVVDASTKDTHSGKLWKWTGEEEPW